MADTPRKSTAADAAKKANVAGTAKKTNVADTPRTANAGDTPSKSNSGDTPEVAKRREREKRTVSQMVALYCADNHKTAQKNETSYAGEALCAQCKALDDYAVLRTARCRKMDVKTSCEQCENHCYAPEMRQRVRAVMRYSGPRMLTKHPIAAIRHLLGK